MASNDETNSVASFVFASETRPAEAMEIHKAVLELAHEAELRARPEDQWHYRPEFGFQYADLNENDPVQAALKELSDIRRARRSDEIGTGAIYHPFVEPVGWILIVIGLVGAGVASEAGKDLWTLLKRGVAKLWRRLRRRGQLPTAIPQLLKVLGSLHNNKTSWNPVVLIQVPTSHLTFVVEPGLPKEALQKVAHLVNAFSSKDKDIPLRWDRTRKRWSPLEEALTEDGLQALRADIQRQARIASDDDWM